MDLESTGAKRKGLISFTVTAKLICAFVFEYADCWFSHEAAHISTSIFKSKLLVSTKNFKAKTETLNDIVVVYS